MWLRHVIHSTLQSEFSDSARILRQAFARPLDAHTRYHKPACYNATFVQPVSLHLKLLGDEPVAYLEPSAFALNFAERFPSASVALSPLFGQRIALLNGKEWTSELASWGDAHETRSNNAGARFNAVLRSYFYRPAIEYSLGSEERLTSLNITLADGREHTLPWLVLYGSGLGDPAACLAAQSDESSIPASRSSSGAVDGAFFALAPREDRQVVLPFDHADKARPIGCFVQTVSTAGGGVERVLVMKVASFSPPGPYLDAWASFLSDAAACLARNFDTVVVDVVQNGGGYVCLGLRLLQMLVEDYFEDNTRVQMRYDIPHSPLMAAFVRSRNLPNPYTDPQKVEQILDPATQAPFDNGSAWYYPGRNLTQGGERHMRSNIFALDCREAEALPAPSYRPREFVPPERLVILTDGTCGSTCASFAKIPQEAGKATLVGAGGLWGQSMDVSSFAGGFVCNPSYLADLARMSGLAFPALLTNQAWQFAWATWYSARHPARQVQFTAQDPDHRTPFWDFPHASVDAAMSSFRMSALYDTVIHDTLTRLASEEAAAGGSSFLPWALQVVLLLALGHCAWFGDWLVLRGRRARDPQAQGAREVLEAPLLPIKEQPQLVAAK